MKDEFYQSKYEYFKKILIILCVAASLAETAYFVSDCQICGKFAIETLIPRFFILIPMLIFLMISKKTNNYKIIIPSAYILLHLVMWCTIWAIIYLPNKTYAREGFIIMHLMFLIAGLAAPRRIAAVAHGLVISNIVISNLFNHYEDFSQMILLAVPCYIGIVAVIWVMENVYREHYELLQKLEKSSKLDQLTGVYNRHKLEDLIIEDTDELINLGHKDIAIAIIDIDLFKNINDTYGHSKGDKVIADSANTIKNTIFNRDYIIRWGGEEFLVIFYNCNMEQAEKKCEIIRQAIENSDNGVCKSTVSIGLAKYTEDNYMSSIENADKALYEAKESGRNKVMVYNENKE